MTESVFDVPEKIAKGVQVAVLSAYGQEMDFFVDLPSDPRFGDFTVSLQSLLGKINEGLEKQRRLSPVEISQTIVKQLPASLCGQVSVENVGPFLNFRVSKEEIFHVCEDILLLSDDYGCSNIGNGQRVMVEFLSPNTNKPLHLGHVRNGALGMAVANILSANGFEVVRANLVNDRGVHICKSMLAWQKWGSGETPKSTGMKGDHFIGKWYIRYSAEEREKPELKEEIQEMLRKWESGDKKILKLWRTMNDWVYAGFQETYDVLGLQFDHIFYESKTYKLGKDVVLAGMKRGTFSRDERGNVIYTLPVNKFGHDKNGKSKCVTILRSDGTSLYVTQDIGTAVHKAVGFDLDRSVYVVGSEQEYHFQCLFQMLADLGYPWTKGLHHLSYGMVLLPDGKMKSREGTVVDADNLVDEVEEMVAKEILSRTPDLLHEEVAHRAKVIALGAIKFYLLRVNPEREIRFDPKESISLDGFTGPYCQYAYARISGLIRNAGLGLAMIEPDYALLENPEERKLAHMLLGFPQAVRSAAENYSPLRVATYIYEVAKTFNQFYNRHKVIDCGNDGLASARLKLAKAAAVVIKNGLALLGIETLERM